MCIKGGNFSISSNTEFTFQNATIYIAPNVEIIVESGAKLNLDNSSLHGCDGLWKGIRLSENSQIHTYNGSLIEDAYKAINAISAFAILDIENTTFNKNLTGIWLESAAFAPNPPFISRLLNSTFKCDGPILGTNEISNHGIFARNNPMVFNLAPDAFVSGNQFRGLKFGIKIEGQATILKCKNFIFREIPYSCIELEKGEVSALNCTFLDYGDNGIKVNGLRKIKVQGCTFHVTEQSVNFIHPPSLARTALLLSSAADIKFPGVVEVDISYSEFTYACPHIENETYDGIRFNLPFVKRKVLIRNENKFIVSGFNSYGITIYGSVDEPDAENIEIYDNDFFITAPNTQLASNTAGITVSGRVNNLDIVANYFNGNNANFGNTPSIDYGIKYQNVIGQNNQIIGNDFNFDFFAGLSMSFSPDVKICSNRTLFCHGFYFLGDNPATNFNRNIFTDASMTIQGSISPQSQRDNVFYNVILNTRATCRSGQCDLFSLFSVRHPLSTEYYPAEQKCGGSNDDCDNDSRFFKNIQGTISPGCASEFQDPGGLDFMLSIAQNNIDDVNEYPYKRTFYESWLYGKLLKNPALANSNPAFTAFLQAKVGSKIAQFASIDNAINAAFFGATTFDLQLSGLTTALSSLEQQIISIDQQLSSSLTPAVIQVKKNLLTFWQSTAQQLEDVSILRANVRNSQLQNISNANSSIVSSTIFDTNQKIVNAAIINLALNAPSPLTLNDVTLLAGISNQCIMQGGNSISQGNALLPVCNRSNNSLPQNCAMELYYPILNPIGEPRAILGSEYVDKNTKIRAHFSGDQIMVFFPQNFDGILKVYDINGVELVSQRVSSEEPVVGVKVREVSSGIFFVTAQSSSELLSTKVGIFR